MSQVLSALIIVYKTVPERLLTDRLAPIALNFHGRYSVAPRSCMTSTLYVRSLLTSNLFPFHSRSDGILMELKKLFISFFLNFLYFSITPYIVWIEAIFLVIYAFNKRYIISAVRISPYRADYCEKSVGIVKIKIRNKMQYFFILVTNRS